MHEFSLASALCDVVLETARAHAAVCVRGVRCRVGVLRQIVPELMRTAFTACAAGTLAESAELELEIDPAHGSCRSCGWQQAVDEVVVLCPRCGSGDTAIAGGNDLMVMAITIDQEADHGNPSIAASSCGERRHRG